MESGGSDSHNYPPDFVPNFYPDFVDAKHALEMSKDPVYHKPEGDIQPDLSDLLSGSVKSSALKNFGLDFVPAPIVYGKAQTEKSRPVNFEKFLSQRKVLQMDPKCEDRCSHTEIAPSSMMTLAMELLVSPDSKASSLFKEAKRKADDSSNEMESILPQLWVVPKCNSEQRIETTASHLQPSIKTTVSVKDNSTKCRKNEAWKQSKASSATKSSPMVPLTQTTYPKSKEAFESVQEYDRHRHGEITSSDVEEDLHRLTVADLVGAPDTIFSDTESEYSDIYQSSRSAVNRALYIDNQKESSDNVPSNLANDDNPPAKNRSPETFDEGCTKCEKPMSSSPTGTASPTLTSLSSSLTFVSSESLSSWNPSSISPEQGKAGDLSPVHNKQFVPETNIKSIYSISEIVTPFKTSESISKVMNHEVSSSSTRNNREPMEESVASKPEITSQPELGVLKSVSGMKPRIACDDQRIDQRNSEDQSISAAMKEYKSTASLKFTNNESTTPSVPTAGPVAPIRKQSLLVMKNMQKDKTKCDKTFGLNTSQPHSTIKINNQSIKQTNVKMEYPHHHTVSLSQIQCKKPAFSMLHISDVKQMQETSNEFATSIGERKDDAVGSSQRKNMTSSSDNFHYAGNNSATMNSIDIPVHTYAKPLHYCNNTSGNNVMSMQIGSDAISDAFCERTKSSKRKQSDRRDMSSETFGTTTEQFSSNSDFELPQSNKTRMYQITKPKNSIAVVDGSKVSLFSPSNVKSHSSSASSPEKCCPAKNLYMSDFVSGNQATLEINFSPEPSIRDFVTEESIVPVTASPKNTQTERCGGHTPVEVGSYKQLLANYHYVPSEKDFVSENQSLANGTSQYDQKQVVHSYNFSEICFPSFETGKNTEGYAANAPSYNACAKPFSRTAMTDGDNQSTTKNQGYNDFVVTQTHPRQVYFTEGNYDGRMQRKSSQTPSEELLPSQLSFGANNNNVNSRRSPDMKKTGGKNFLSQPTEYLSSNREKNFYPSSPKSSPTKNVNQEASKEVYSSCVKIKLNPTFTANDERAISSNNEGNVNALSGNNNVYPSSIGTGKGVSQNLHSSPLKSGIVTSDKYENADKKTVGEVVMPELKRNETDISGEPQADNRPKHSVTDESDFAGVVDGSCKNVKEIRAMFKRGPDYANYAKPKLSVGKPTHHPRLASYPQPAAPTTRKSNGNYHQTEVAQHVMGLFKNALVVDFEPISPPQIAAEETQSEKQTKKLEDGLTNGSTEPRISVKDKVASFNVGKSPVEGTEVNNNNNTHKLIDDVNRELEELKTQQKRKEHTATPEDVIISNTTTKKTLQDLSLKPTASSYDESLDQFYDVFEALTTSS